MNDFTYLALSNSICSATADPLTSSALNSCPNGICGGSASLYRGTHPSYYKCGSSHEKKKLLISYVDSSRKLHSPANIRKYSVFISIFFGGEPADIAYATFRFPSSVAVAGGNKCAV